MSCPANQEEEEALVTLFIKCCRRPRVISVDCTASRALARLGRALSWFSGWVGLGEAKLVPRSAQVYPGQNQTLGPSIPALGLAAGAAGRRGRTDTLAALAPGLAQLPGGITKPQPCTNPRTAER